MIQSPTMSLGSEYDISPRKAAAIADYFQKADKLMQYDQDVMNSHLSYFIEQFGRLNFATLEEIFRANKFKTHFLALPTTMIELRNPQVRIVDPTDLLLHKKWTPKPFVAIAFPNLDFLVNTYKGFGLRYDQASNLRNLKEAGVFTSNPLYEGNLTMSNMVLAPPFSQS